MAAGIVTPLIYKTVFWRDVPEDKEKEKVKERGFSSMAEIDDIQLM